MYEKIKQTANNHVNVNLYTNSLKKIDKICSVYEKKTLLQNKQNKQKVYMNNRILYFQQNMNTGMYIFAKKRRALLHATKPHP